MKRTAFAGVMVAAALCFFLAGRAAAEAPKFDRLADAHVCLESVPCSVHQGVITQVMEWQFTEGKEDPNHAIVLRVRAEDGDFLAYMGPVRFHEQMGNEFKLGDKIKMSGAVVNVGGREVVISSSFTASGGSTLMIRDDRGRLLSLK